jgi:hypothetical protein
MIDKNGDHRRHYRQSRTGDCAPVELHACSRFRNENKSGSVTISCFSGGLSCFIPNKRLTGPVLLSDSLDRMLSIADATGFHAQMLALDFAGA